MTLSRKIPLPESRLEVSAPPARFESGRRAPGVVGRSRTDRSRSIHGAFAPNVNCPPNRGRSRHQPLPIAHARPSLVAERVNDLHFGRCLPRSAPKLSSEYLPGTRPENDNPTPRPASESGHYSRRRRALLPQMTTRGIQKLANVQ